MKDDLIYIKTVLQTTLSASEHGNVERYYLLQSMDVALDRVTKIIKQLEENVCDSQRED